MELSPRVTAWGWVLFGIGLLGYSVFVAPDTSSGWRELEILWHFGLGVCGLLFGLLGFRVLRRPAGVAAERSIDDPSRRSERRAWVLIWSGMAMFLGVFLGVMLTPGINDRDIDASPQSLALMALAIGGLLCGLIGRSMLMRLRQSQSKDAAPAFKGK